jgi:solute:Na+ symporter, SSS family
MEKRLLCIAACLVLIECSHAFCAVDETPAQGILKWSELPQLPPAPGYEKQIGLAGTFAGANNDALIVAGGANFPEALPWENGQKIWWEDIFVLEKAAEGKYQWLTDKSFKLPKPSAYGVSISTPEGIVCIGGCDAERCHKDVFLLKWDPEAKHLSMEAMPSLPRPLAFMAGAMVRNTIFVAGGQETMNGGLATKNFFALDLSKKNRAGEFKWRELDAWPGPARIANLAVSQSDGSAECFYMFSGRNPGPDKSTEILTDAYKYNPVTGKWEKLADITLNDDEEPRCIMAGTAIDYGDNHVLVFGGDRGDLFLELEQLSQGITQAEQEANNALSEQLKSKHTQMLIHHLGFSKDILAYNTITDSWDNISELPTSSHVTTSAVYWNGSIVIPSGEIRPGVRTSRIWQAEAALRQSDIDNTPVSADGDVTLWDRLPDLPCSQGLTDPFVGVHENILIIAGGTSLDEHDGKTVKVWHDDIWILAKNSEGTYTWIDRFRLDKPRANGAAVSTDQGVVCIGGNDASQTFADGIILSWNKDTQTLNINNLPNLPSPCTNTSAALISSELTNTIYVAGGQSGLDPDTTLHNFWALDLPRETGDLNSVQWRKVYPWPGPSRASNLTISQHNGKADCIYVISGQGFQSDHRDHGQIKSLVDVYEFNPLLYDAQTYNPETGEYTGQGLQANPWCKRADVPHSVEAGAGIDVGQSHIFIFGGDDAGNSQASDPSTHTDNTAPPNKLLMYHTITNTWISKDALPGNFMKTNLVKWDDSIVVAAGETKKGVPTASIWKVTPVERNRFFGVVNFLVIGCYLAALVGVGVFFAFRQKNTDDFFRGGQRIPWFVAGCSIFATMLSSLTFIAIPAKAFMTDWTFIVINIGIVVITPFVVAYVLPFFRHIDATSAYEYLEKRFNVTARLFGSASFILFQIGRMAVVMFLTALPLAAITPLSVIQCILIMGIISIVYSTMGGLEAVVWTDTIQTFVLLGGALLSYVIVIRSLDGGFGDFLSIAARNGKFNMINWDFSASSYMTAAIWVVILGGIGQNLVPYVSDMAVVQRYMSVSDEKRAAKGIWTNAIMVIPATLIFFGLGAALFVFYQAHPEKLDPTLQNDAIFPLFIARELPIGIAGLVVAGVFSAAQSTLSTSMNSTSTAFVTDFIRRFSGRLSERTYLQMARVATVLFGALGTLVAILLVLSDIKSLWDVFMAILGLLGSSMCGLFMLGMYTRRANGIGAVTGALAGAVGLYLVKTYTSMHFLLYTTVGIGLCFVVGYLMSLVIGGKQTHIEGLTVYTLNKET